MQKKRIAIFASGKGSNALNIIDHFSDHKKIEVAVVITNKSEAPVVQNAKNKDVEVICLSNESAANSSILIDICSNHNVDYIVLAGYLRKIPVAFVSHYQDRIMNIHPALLPKFGGKGMYGDFVHEAVLENEEKETGITIHFVNEQFDEGRILAQFHCPVKIGDTLKEIRERVQQLEQRYFPFVIEQTILSEMNY
jgi:phosphoribosylglycinamide formyltransferase-1